MIEAILERARAIADDALFARALETDAEDLLPVDLLDLLASAGFYGMAAPRDVGGWELDRAKANRVIEVLASGCLTTTFVWLQHHNALRAVASSGTPGLRDAWLAPLARGERRAGIAHVGERPGPPSLTAEPSASGGIMLVGEAPWVSGWGRIDVVSVAARRGDNVVRVLVDAVEGPTLEVEPLRLVAANASGTVTLRFNAHTVPAERLLDAEQHEQVVAMDAAGLRTNGSLALGVAWRALDLLGPSVLDAELVAVRSGLDAAGPGELPAARAAAAELAWRATGSLVIAHGARSIVTDHHAQRLAREALFLLVFGSRPAIKDELAKRVGMPGAGPRP